MPIASGTFSCHPTSTKTSSNQQPVPSKQANIVTEEILVKAFKQCEAEDSGYRQEAINAYDEMLLKSRFVHQLTLRRTSSQNGLVQRRAPKNPLRARWMGQFRAKSSSTKEKVGDPALEKGSLQGRLRTAFITTASVLMVFLQSLVANKVETGLFHAPYSYNSMLGPSYTVLESLGGLSTNYIRKGQEFRLFWSMWMHAGWIHIGFNVLCQIQYLWMLEPDWGFWRTLTLFLVSGVTGNLLSSVCDPCSVSVGSSGALFGLMGGMLPYCIEFWRTIPRPWLICLFSVFVLVRKCNVHSRQIVSICTGFTGSTDNWAHMGGMLGGLLFGFGTTTTAAACDGTNFKFPISWPWSKSKGAADHEDASISTRSGSTDGRGKVRPVSKFTVTRAFQRKIEPKCKCAPLEWLIRFVSWALLIAFWGVLIYYLFVNFNYTSPGHVTFSGTRSCCCCDFAEAHEVRKFWTCNYCDVITTKGDLWETVCKMSNEENTDKAPPNTAPPNTANQILSVEPSNSYLKRPRVTKSIPRFSKDMNSNSVLLFLKAKTEKISRSKSYNG